MTSADSASVVFPPHVRAALDTSGAQGAPLMIAYTDPNGHVRPSYRGSTHVDGDSRLATWVRNPSGGLPSFVAGTPGAPVEVIYRNPRTDSYYHVLGHARLASDQETLDRVYQQSPPHEQMADPERRGVAMLIDVHRIAGYDQDGPVGLGTE